MTQKIAVITGAGGGIGRAAASALAADGYAVILAGRTPKKLDAACAQIVARGGTAIAMECDVTDVCSVDELFARAVDVFGRVDLLFNNAGVNAPVASIEDVPVAVWAKILSTNVTGAFFCTQAAFRVMKTQVPAGGRIINNGSVAAQTPRPHSSPYAISKHAITGLTKSAGLDGRPYDIAVSQIDIGNASTEMTDYIAQGLLQANGRYQAEPTFDVAHVGAMIAHIASLPLHANVPFVTLVAAKMPLLGRG